MIFNNIKFNILNFIVNLIFIGVIIYFIIKNSNCKCCNCGNSKNGCNCSNQNLNLKEPVKKPPVKEPVKKPVKKPVKEPVKEPKKKEKYEYNEKLCNKCIQENHEKGLIRNCSHCAADNLDSYCIPTLVYKDVPNNTIPINMDPRSAYWACKSSSNSAANCHLIHPDYQLDYQKKIAKGDYYCAFDKSDSCSYNKCRIDDYYSFGPQAYCGCYRPPHEPDLPEGTGRECILNGSCAEYDPNIKSPDELITDPALSRFMSGYDSWMDVLTTSNKGKLLESLMVA